MLLRILLLSPLLLLLPVHSQPADASEDGPDGRLMHILYLFCSPQHYSCPMADYGIFNNTKWEWNITAINETPIAKTFRETKNLTKQHVEEALNHLCCERGECLRKCGLKPIPEGIDLVEQFPGNANELLALNHPEIEKFRQAILSFVKNPERERPEVITEFFDVLYFNQDEIRRLLKEKKEKTSS